MNRPKEKLFSNYGLMHSGRFDMAVLKHAPIRWLMVEDVFELHFESICGVDIREPLLRRTPTCPCVVTIPPHPPWSFDRGSTRSRKRREKSSRGEMFLFPSRPITRTGLTLQRSHACRDGVAPIPSKAVRNEPSNNLISDTTVQWIVRKCIE